MKKLLLIPVLLLTLTLGWSLGPNRAEAHSDHRRDSIVGAWYVDAVGAPYVPHQFTFHSDGIVLTTNPTNVQEDPNAPHGGANDSVGMGTWRLAKEHGKRYVVGTFEQLNANADDHMPADKLSVTFKVSVDDGGFEGPAIAKLGGLTAPATLEGTRILIDQDALDDL